MPRDTDDGSNREDEARPLSGLAPPVSIGAHHHGSLPALQIV
jgi:hypothetical protein